MMPRGTWFLACVLGGAMVASGCGEGEIEDPESELVGALARPGRWIPNQVGPSTGYDDAPPWNGGRNCTGTFTSGAKDLKAYLLSRFPQISEIQGYSCRPNTANTSQTSVHGTGRALDVFIPTSGGAADNDKGDTVANFLIEHADEIGVQFIIWDRTSWGGSRPAPRHRAYTGPNPHVDHIHVEITLQASRRQTPFFTGGNTVDEPDDGGGNTGGGTTGGAAGRVDTSGAPLRVRSGPGTGFPEVGNLPDGARVTIGCQVRGTTITGMFGTTNLWDFVGNGYVSDAYVNTGSSGQVAPTCN